MSAVTQGERESEWRIGWRVVLASAIGNGTGVSLLFLTFSMFLLPIGADLGLGRGEVGTVQSLIITAALGAPLVGWLIDRRGFRWAFTLFTLLMALAQIAMALWVNSLWSLALAIAMVGLLGGGNSAVSLTRPVNAHFHRHRGVALGLVGAGVSVTMIIVPPLLQLVIDGEGWRGGLIMLTAISTLVGLPLVLALMPGHIAVARGAKRAGPGDRGFWAERDFWLLALANVTATCATSGVISQLAPMLREEGLSAAVAAWGVSAFAAGQLIGKLAGGLLLDRFDPRAVAVLVTILPVAGLIVFLANPGLVWAVLLASALIGLLHGADVDIFAYFVARRFGMDRYGTVFGALHGLGWGGTALGIGGFGFAFDLTGGYEPAQLAAIGLLVVGALLLLPIRLDQRGSGASSSRSTSAAA